MGSIANFIIIIIIIGDTMAVFDYQTQSND